MKLNQIAQKENVASVLRVYKGFNPHLLSADFRDEWTGHLRSLYSGFDDWLNHKNNRLDSRLVVFNDTYNTGNSLAVAIYKYRSNNRIKICNFYVREDARSFGCGKTFLNSLLNILKISNRCNFAYLTVKQSENLSGFYLSNGFSLFGTKNTASAGAEDILTFNLLDDFGSSNDTQGYSIIPIRPEFIQRFLDLNDGHGGAYKSWEYISGVPNIEAYRGTRSLIYVTSPFKAIIGDVRLTTSPIPSAKKVLSFSEQRNMDVNKSIYLSDFIFYPKPLELNDLIGSKALNWHPQRLHSIQLPTQFFRQLGCQV